MFRECLLYGTGGGYYGIVEGLIWREGERPYAYQCFGTAKPGSADPFDTLLPVTQDLRLKINVWLAKKISGGFKIYASIVFYFDTHYCQNNKE